MSAPAYTTRRCRACFGDGGTDRPCVRCNGRGYLRANDSDELGDEDVYAFSPMYLPPRQVSL